MNPIYYTSKGSGDSFKLVFMTQDSEQIDVLLDSLLDCVENYITEAEFEAACEEKMKMNIMDADEVVKIGELTCKKIDLEDGMIIN